MFERKHAQGATLIITLFFLLITTLIGTGTLLNSLLQERKTGNFKSKQITSENAESALRDGETLIAELKSRPFPGEKIDSSPHVWPIGKLDELKSVASLPWPKQPNSWWKVYGQPSEILFNPSPDPENPAIARIIIEEKVFKRDSLSLNTNYAVEPTGVAYYLVSARSTGNNASIATLQSTFARRFN